MFSIITIFLPSDKYLEDYFPVKNDWAITSTLMLRNSIFSILASMLFILC